MVVMVRRLLDFFLQQSNRFLPTTSSGNIGQIRFIGPRDAQCNSETKQRTYSEHSLYEVYRTQALCRMGLIIITAAVWCQQPPLHRTLNDITSRNRLHFPANFVKIQP